MPQAFGAESLGTSLHGRPYLTGSPDECAGALPDAARGGRPRWRERVPSTATLAVLLARLDGSITLIAMRGIFGGIHLDPLALKKLRPLRMILGYLISSVLIVSLGRRDECLRPGQGLQSRPHLRDHRLPGGRRGLADARQALSLR